MQTQTLYPHTTIAEVFGQAWNDGKLTANERTDLMFALLEQELNSEDYDAIDRLLHAVRRGWIQMLD